MITVQFFKQKQPAVHIECHPANTAPELLASSDAFPDARSDDNFALDSDSTCTCDSDSSIVLQTAPHYSPTRLPRLNKRAAAGIVREFRERHADYNVGGSSKRKLMTSYREKALHLAQLLHQHGTLSPLRLRQLTGNPQTAGYLQKNYYQWFQRVERGVYRLSPLGEDALITYRHVVAELPPSLLSDR